MGFLSKIFRKKERKEQLDELRDFKEKDIAEVTEYRDGYPVCDGCGLTIGENQKRKTFNGKKFHLKMCC